MTPPAPLPPLPPQPVGVPWPTAAWPAGPPSDDVVVERRLHAAVDVAFGPTGQAAMGATNAVVVVQGGVIVAERYGPGIDAETTLPSWSMAKSILHTLVGVLVADGRMALDQPAGVAAWSGVDDPRSAITLDQLLHMRSGLAWREDYVIGHESDVQEMLFGTGRPDVAAYAAGRPLAHRPGSTYEYSSGTSCIVSALTRDLVGGPDDYRRFMHDALFDRIGMRSPIPKFDAAGTWIGSSYCFATARDFARFGLLQLRGGTWDGEVVIPRSWVDHARAPQPDVDDEGWGYGAHWWNLPDRTDGLFFANGHRGQYLWIVPALDLLIVRSGDSGSDQRDAVVAHLESITACFSRT